LLKHNYKSEEDHKD